MGITIDDTNLEQILQEEETLFYDLILDVEKRNCLYDGNKVYLTRKQYSFFLYLAEHSEDFVSYEEIFDELDIKEEYSYKLKQLINDEFKKVIKKKDFNIISTRSTFGYKINVPTTKIQIIG